MAWAANSREQEFAADQHEVEVVGKQVAAQALLRATVTEYLPWTRLSSVVEASLESNEPVAKIFITQARQARSTRPSEWEDAFRKAMKQKTGIFDSHPSLKERLAALGVSPKKALPLLQMPPGAPACEMLPQWEKIELELSEKLLGPLREFYLARRDVAQILLSRPLH
jgi:hypothetical protein